MTRKGQHDDGGDEDDVDEDKVVEVEEDDRRVSLAHRVDALALAPLPLAPSQARPAPGRPAVAARPASAPAICVSSPFSPTTRLSSSELLSKHVIISGQKEQEERTRNKVRKKGCCFIRGRRESPKINWEGVVSRGYVISRVCVLVVVPKHSVSQGNSQGSNRTIPATCVLRASKIALSVLVLLPVLVLV